MIILGSVTSDVLRVTASAATAVDIHCSFVDNQTLLWLAGRQNTALATTSTTTILSTPAASTQRQLKCMTASARGGANTLTLEFFDGTNAYRVFSVALAIGETLAYEEHAGWMVMAASGALKTAIAFL